MARDEVDRREAVEYSSWADPEALEARDEADRLELSQMRCFVDMEM